MCLNLNVLRKSSLRYATKDKICYKVLRIQKDNDKEHLHAPYYVEFEYELNKKYNTEMKPRGHILYAKNVSNIWYSDLEFELAQAIDQYYARIETFRFITCGFHTVNSLKDAIYLKKDFENDHFRRKYRIFECIIPKGSWYYVGFDDLHKDGFVSDSLIIKKEIECAW